MKALIKFDCPGCGNSLEGESDLEFELVTCSVCQNQFYPKPLKAAVEKAAHPLFPPPALERVLAPPPSPAEIAARNARAVRDQLTERVEKTAIIGHGFGQRGLGDVCARSPHAAKRGGLRSD